MSEESNRGDLSRREFVGAAGATVAGLTLMPGRMFAGERETAPSDRLNIAGVGVGGYGRINLRNMASENIVALCDVDWRFAESCFEEFPKARRYRDWRRMLDEMGASIDAVVIATADHTHAVVAAHAMTLGKHVYVQKPLTHSVYESRLLTRLAETHQIATQMGNQGASGEGVRRVAEWIWRGEIGEVRRVEAYTDRPIWPQGLTRPKQGLWVPEYLNWDLFVGPAAMRPYHEIYTPWNWRGWWDFGTGAFGDMACHVLHPVFVGLQLGYPSAIQGSSTLLLSDCAPTAETVRMTFPARKKFKKVRLPEVEVIWYDGGIQPMKPEGWPAGKDMNDHGGGVVFHGSKDTLVCGCYGRDPWLLSGRQPKVETSMRTVELSHEMDWVRACKESPGSRVETSSPFSEAGPFNEIVLMGVLAVRLQGLNKELEWDGAAMRFTNITSGETISSVVEDKFRIVDGLPTFDKDWTEPVPAADFATGLIEHEYREGWSLPDMPA